jgi:hypothetical protein
MKLAMGSHTDLATPLSSSGGATGATAPAPRRPPSTMTGRSLPPFACQAGSESPERYDPLSQKFAVL